MVQVAVDQSKVSRLPNCWPEVERDSSKERAVVPDVFGEQLGVRGSGGGLEVRGDALTRRFAAPASAVVLDKVCARVEQQSHSFGLFERDFLPGNLEGAALMQHQHLRLVVQGQRIGLIALVLIAGQRAR